MSASRSEPEVVWRGRSRPTPHDDVRQRDVHRDQLVESSEARTLEIWMRLAGM